MNQLILGIGNFSKPVLQQCEHIFTDVSFGVLDVWSQVQRIEVNGESWHTEDVTIRSKYDLSYFTKAPEVNICFSTDKYRLSETQVLLPWTFDYRNAIRSQFDKTRFDINTILECYQQIIIVADATDEILMEFIPILQWIKSKSIQLRILSYFLRFLKEK